jgi:predicted CoA-binding protein
VTSRAAVEDFLAQKSLAVVGVSRDGKKFGNVVYRDLLHKGYQVFAVNPNAHIVENKPCYSSLGELPERVEGVVFVIPPSETEKMVREAADRGIRRVWMQQGSESEQAIRFCEENGISVVAGECILMFAEPVGFLHRVHRAAWRILGKLPE